MKFGVICAIHLSFVEIARGVWRSPLDVRLDGFGAAIVNATSSNQTFLAIGTEDAGVSDGLTCETTNFVGRHDNPRAKCPSECPYFVQNAMDSMFCTTVCVTQDRCAHYNPSTPIGDMERGICRSANVPNCFAHRYDGTDTCLHCQIGYSLTWNGQCVFKYWWIVVVLGVVVSLFILFIFVWIIDLVVRRPTNEESVKLAIENRERQKLHMPIERAEDRAHFWSLFTNLTRESQVAGPGVTLHFNFQMCVIAWALWMAAGWALCGYLLNPEVLELGTRPFGTPRENCILVAWGFATQQETMWIKVGFLFAAYLGTFLLCIVHGLNQLQKYHMSREQKTMVDYCALVSNLPILSGRSPGMGERSVEEELAKAIEDSVWASSTVPASPRKEKVVGVSICWDFYEKQDAVSVTLRKKLVEEDDFRKRIRQTSRQASQRSSRINSRLTSGRISRSVTRIAAEFQGMNRLRRLFYYIEKLIWVNTEDLDEDIPIEEILSEMSSSTYAFCVFQTTELRDQALKAPHNTINFRGNALELSVCSSEPDTVNWQNWGSASEFHPMCWRLAKGLGLMAVTMLLWMVFFYAPYAWSVFTFNYDNGAQPGMMYGISFTLIVALGNALMYAVAAEVADRVGFCFKDHREGCYMLLYSLACLVQYLLDAVCCYYTAKQIMIGLGLRINDGRMLRDLDSFVNRFESYAMQRVLAENLYDYAWPSTFLIPFLIEPFATIVLPEILGVLVLRSHPEIRGIYAEELLTNAPMEMGRYADIIFNIMLGALVFYFPGGYTIQLFMYMALAHVFIYFYDHCRVLRVVPKCTFSTNQVDYFCQAMLAPCTGIILSSLVFKANCHGYGYCVEGPMVIAIPAAAWILHVVVHLFLVMVVVPHVVSDRFVSQDCAPHMSYEDIAVLYPASWFSTNPVHCLRSQVMYQHAPPCIYYHIGKEHLLEVNREIGCFYKAAEAEVEDDVYSKISHSLTSRLSHAISSARLSVR